MTIVDAQDNHLDLAFDVNGRWLFTNNRIKESDLPPTVKASIQANFAGYEIKKAFRLDMANGSKQYIAELRNGNIRPNVLFNANGSIICKNGRDENPD